MNDSDFITINWAAKEKIALLFRFEYATSNVGKVLALKYFHYYWKMKRQILSLCFFALVIAVANAQSNTILIPYQLDTKWGYADTTGTLKIPATYDKVDFCRDGRCQVYQDGLTGFIAADGSSIIGVLYEELKATGSHIQAKFKGKWGLIDSRGSIVVPTEFDKVGWLSKDFLEIRRNNYSGVVRVMGRDMESVLPISFKNVEYVWYENKFICTTDDGIVAYGENGEKRDADAGVLEQVMEAAQDFEIPETHSVIKKNGKQFLLVTTQDHRHGGFLRDTINTPYDSIAPFTHRGFVMMKLKNKWGLMDDEGKVILSPEFDGVEEWLTSVREGEFFMKKKGKWGVIKKTFSKDGKLISSKDLVPFEYDSFKGYGRDYFIVQKKGLYGVMSNVTFKPVTPVKYQKVESEFVYTYTSFIVFKVTDGTFKDVYVGKNGVAFYKK